MTKMGNVTKQSGIMQVNTLKSLEKLYAYWKIKKKIHIIKTKQNKTCHRNKILAASCQASEVVSNI